MTDQQPDRAEQAFRDALAQRADEPDFHPLTVPTRQRRPGWMRPVAAAAAVVVVAGVGFTAARFLTGVPGSGVGTAAGVPAATVAAEGEVDRRQPEAAPPPQSWRQVSFGNVIVGVPDTWGDDFSPGGDWCSSRASHPSRPFVNKARTHRAENAILCEGPITAGQLQTHLLLQWTVAAGPRLPYQLPTGWKVSWASFSEVTVGVVHPDDQQPLADQILGSVTEVTVDHNGCPVHSDIQSSAFGQPDQAEGIGGLASADKVVVCQYDVTRGSSPGLSASRIVHGNQANQILIAIKAAPLGGGPDDRSQCIGDGPDSTAVVVRITSGETTREVYVYYTSCTHNGFFDGTEARALTAAACQPLIAPPLFISGGWGPAVQLCVPDPAPEPTPSK